MQTVSATEAKQNFAAILDQVQRGPVVIRRHDREVAVLVSPQDYERIRQLRIAELKRLAKENSAYAEGQGMTDELLEKLLADER